MADVESGEKAPLLADFDRKWLKQYEDVPVGGHPGHPKFWKDVAIAGRTSVFACILAVPIWSPAVGKYVDPGFLPFIPLTVLLVMLNMNPVFGAIVGNATAAMTGTFLAVFNIFMLRGFFPDGVEPGDGPGTAASIAGWFDLLIFNLAFLCLDVRMGTRMFAMANNTGFILAFLNPADKSVYSKNFVINPNGIAVTVLKVTFIGIVLTMLANLLPMPFKFATNDMKENAELTSAGVSKVMISAVDYYNRDSANVIIHQQMGKTKIVEAQVGDLGGSIDAAWYEGFDVGTRGIVRGLHEKHAALMGECMTLVKAIEIAISTEDFGPSHREIMGHIGYSSADLVNSVGELLMTVTAAAADGDISRSETDDLVDQENAVNEKVKQLAMDFNRARQSNPNWTAVNAELLNESFFVFALSAYARKIVDYSDNLRSNKPEGVPVAKTVIDGVKATFDLSKNSNTHYVLAARSWFALFFGFLYGVQMDNYGGACAITLVFLMSTRVAPDVLSLLYGLVAAIVASAMTAIIFTRACGSGYGNYMLPGISFFYWWLGLYISFSGCEFATIGLLMAALSPFGLVIRCPPMDQLGGPGAALGLWIGIRGFMIALVIMSIAEFMSSPDLVSRIAIKNVDQALTSLTDALRKVWKEEIPDDEIAAVPGCCGNAKTFGTAAMQEPRFWKAKWKGDLLLEVVRWIEIAHLDVNFLRMATHGKDGSAKEVFEILSKCPTITGKLAKDLDKTLIDSRTISVGLLAHEQGPFLPIDKITITGLDTLDGFEESMEEVSKLLPFPDVDSEIETLEDDLICQISIVFVMLDYLTKRAARIISVCVKDC